MIRLRLAIQLHYQVQPPGGDFVFHLHAAFTPRQRVVSESLHFSQPLAYTLESSPPSTNRVLRTSALPGMLQVAYAATVDLDHWVAAPATIAEVPVSRLPTNVLPYLYPSRYCQSDLLNALAMSEFGTLPHGYARVQAIQEWVQQRVKFKSSSSNSMTSAIDTLRDGVGVCRDFAHLMIALCRAVNIPARFTTGIDFGADPALGPTDFHAYVEAYLGHNWYLFDPSGTAIPMGFVRIGTGHDAADASFATIFGAVTSEPPHIEIAAHLTPQPGSMLPYRRGEGVSTDGQALPQYWVR